MNIYVGNLPHELTEEELRQAFETFGEVTSARIITRKRNGMSRGFGFVEMPTKAEAQAAITGLNGTELKGQALNVNEARPRSESRQKVVEDEVVDGAPGKQSSDVTGS